MKSGLPCWLIALFICPWMFALAQTPMPDDLGVDIAKVLDPAARAALQQVQQKRATVLDYKCHTENVSSREGVVIVSHSEEAFKRPVCYRGEMTRPRSDVSGMPEQVTLAVSDGNTEWLQNTVKTTTGSLLIQAISKVDLERLRREAPQSAKKLDRELGGTLLRSIGMAGAVLDVSKVKVVREDQDAWVFFGGTMEVSIGKKDGLPREVSITEKEGQTRCTVSALRVNTGVEADCFQFTPVPKKLVEDLTERIVQQEQEETVRKQYGFVGTDKLVIAGKVVDATTRAPVIGIPLMVEGFHRGERYDQTVREITTNPEGVFSLSVTSGSMVQLQWAQSNTTKFLIDSEWKQQHWLPFQEGSLSKSKTDVVIPVKLRPTVVLRGQALNPQKQGLACAFVYTGNEREAICADEDGVFTLNNAPADKDYDLFVVSYNRDFSTVARLKAGTTATSITLAPTRTYEGIAKNSDGQPAKQLSLNWSLEFNAPSQFSLQESMGEIITDDAGKFNLRNMYPQGKYHVSWDSTGLDNDIYDYEDTKVDLASIPEGKPVQLDVKVYSHKLSGRVVDENEQPIAGAKVTATDMDSHLVHRIGGEIYQGIQTDADGCFSAKHLASGEIPLRISAPGRKAKNFTTRTDDAGFLATLMPSDGKGPQLSIAVKDELGRPVPDAKIALNSITNLHGEMSTTTSTQCVVTNAEGVAAFSFDGQRTNPRMRSYVVCDAPGYNYAFRTVRQGEDAEIEMKLEKEEQKKWRGRITDEEGKALPQAKVIVDSIYNEKISARNCSGMASDQRFSYTCDTEGRFSLDRFNTTDTLQYTVKADGYLSEENTYGWSFVANGTPPEEKTSVLVRGVKLHGKIVLPDGSPAPGSWTVYATHANDSGTLVPEGKTGAFEMTVRKGMDCKLAASAATTETLKWLCLKQTPVKMETGKEPEATITVEPGIPVSGKFVFPQFFPMEKVPRIYLGANRVNATEEQRSFSTTIESENFDKPWTLYLPEGTFGLNYYMEEYGSGKVEKKVTVEKNKPLEPLSVEVKVQTN
ncbi:TPA: hypothetical protein DDW35_09490 [Candidatus Sumerlaeota bacterium]|nr:hypothetical protein [Candidatus Sumerlaeota bacterium]